MADWPFEAVKIVASVGVGYFAKGAIEYHKARRPVDFNVDQDIWRIYGNVPNWVSFPYYFDCEPDNLPEAPPDHGIKWQSWALENHGIPAVGTEIQVVISTRTERTILVNNLRIDVVSIKPAPKGTTTFLPVGGAAMVNRQIAIEIDSFCPRIKFRDRGGEEQGSDGFAFALKKDEVAKFSITARAVEGDYLYKWRGLLDVIVGGKLRTVTIDNQGSPFVLHGGKNTSQCEWWGHWSNREPQAEV
jgi:hypothetical protein